jgi:hypothetical protein
MLDHDDAVFHAFTRNLARRHRRPRSYPKAPTPVDALEHLCGGGTVFAVPESNPSLTELLDDDTGGEELGLS